MATHPYIDIEKSIASGWLYCKKDWLDKAGSVADKFVSYVLLVALAGAPLLVYFQGGIKNSNEKTVAYIIIPIILLAALYAFYRKILENRLISIRSDLPIQKKKAIITTYLEGYGYKVVSTYKNVIVADIEDTISFGKKRATIMLTGDSIYFTLVKDYPRLNPPVFIDHLFLKHDLKQKLSAG